MLLIAVSLERWCRLRGNLLFYFKTSDQFSEPQGVIVLEKCEPVIRNEKREHDGFVFFIGKFNNTNLFSSNSAQCHVEFTIKIMGFFFTKIKCYSYSYCD